MKINEISKYISFILRHKPEEIGITLDGHGWEFGEFERDESYFGAEREFSRQTLNVP